MFQKCLESVDILETRGDFEAGIQIDADTLWVVESLNTLCILRTDTSTQQEGSVALIGG